MTHPDGWDELIGVWCTMGAGCVSANRGAASGEWTATAKGRHPISGELFSVTVRGPFHMLPELLVEQSPHLTSLLTDPQFSGLIGQAPGGNKGEGAVSSGETICPETEWTCSRCRLAYSRKLKSCPYCGAIATHGGDPLATVRKGGG